jgi:hypothetical protein
MLTGEAGSQELYQKTRDKGSDRQIDKNNTKAMQQVAVKKIPIQ